MFVRNDFSRSSFDNKVWAKGHKKTRTPRFDSQWVRLDGYHFRGKRWVSPVVTVYCFLLAQFLSSNFLPRVWGWSGGSWTELNWSNVCRGFSISKLDLNWKRKETIVSPQAATRTQFPVLDSPNSGGAFLFRWISFPQSFYLTVHWLKFRQGWKDC